MPMTQHVHYLVRFKLADGEHIAASQSIKAMTNEQKRFVTGEITRSLNPPLPDYPDGNPDFAIIEIREASIEEILEAAAKLRETPGRIGADQIGLDHPSRIISEPAITQNIAATQVPG
jgi:hypothetical protein